jgi:hypothetical protein
MVCSGGNDRRQYCEGEMMRRETSSITPTFQAKHYRALATALAGLDAAHDRNYIIAYFCNVLRNDNPKFDELKFRRYIKEITG